MTIGKRVMDLLLSLSLLVVLAPVMAAIAAVIWLRDGGPVFYVSERMKAPGEPFDLWKFRTMAPAERNSGVSGGDKTHRITRTGLVLRRHRLDEMPQLWNILRGDISFVGPRPPLRRYVEQFPDLYTRVLKARPGLTGLATLVFHRTEERLLANCATAAETEETYVRRCVPAKAKLDLIYAENRGICFDLWLILATVIRRVPVRLKLN